MKELPDNYSLRQAYNDIFFLAERHVALEDAIAEWSEFLTAELLKQGVRNIKDKKGLEYFKKSLSHTHKQTFEKLETLFKIIKSEKGSDIPL